MDDASGVLATSGYDLIESDLTGLVLLNEALNVLKYLRQSRPLERVFGVDNLSRQSIVMLQYKMLEPSGREGGLVSKR